MIERTPLNRAADLAGRQEAHWRAIRHYRAEHSHAVLEFELGEIYRLRRDVVDWVERDSPGTLEPADD